MEELKPFKRGCCGDSKTSSAARIAFALMRDGSIYGNAVALTSLRPAPVRVKRRYRG